jgi:hypothetical protein
MNDTHLVLHGLAIKKHAAPQDLTDITGLDVETVTSVLAEAEARRRVVMAAGKFMLTGPAQMALRAEYSRVHADLRTSAAMNEAYGQFEKINAQLKLLITDWQTLDVGGKRVPNDHSSADYDRQLIDRLGALHERAEPVLDGMAKQVPRLSVYPRKLIAALEKAEDGAVEWVSDAKLASYHTVWFEMHEDLLRILGRERVE